METKFTVPEISCGHCKETIESTVNNIESVVSVAVDIEQKLIISSKLNELFKDSNLSNAFDSELSDILKNIMLYAPFGYDEIDGLPHAPVCNDV